LDRTLAILATLAASTVAAMSLAILYTHSSQDFFQTAHPIEAAGPHLATPLSLLICGSISAWTICS
jgi:hypothetical protein